MVAVLFGWTSSVDARGHGFSYRKKLSPVFALLWVYLLIIYACLGYRGNWSQWICTSLQEILLHFISNAQNMYYVICNIWSLHTGFAIAISSITINSTDKWEDEAPFEFHFGFNCAPEAYGVQFENQFMNLTVFNYTLWTVPLHWCAHLGNQCFLIVHGSES